MTKDQAKTAVVFFACLFGFPLLMIAVLLGWEAKTLLNRIPDDHITASMRAALKAEPWAVVGLLLVWVALMSGALMLCVGHFYG